MDLSSVAGSGPQGRITREDVERALAARESAGADTAGRGAVWPDGKVRAVPAARRLARELRVDLLASQARDLQAGSSRPMCWLQRGRLSR